MSREWTSRKRVQVALGHHEPDRVPVHIAIDRDAYLKLCQYLGFLPGQYIQSDDCDEARIAPEVARFLGVDLICVRLRLPLHCEQPEDGQTFYDTWHIGRRKSYRENGYFFLETVESPLKDARLEDLRDFPWPDPEDPSLIDGLEDDARQLFFDTDLALVGRFGGSILETARDLRGEMQWHKDLIENPDFACALLNRIAGLQIAFDEAGLRAVGKFLSILEIREPEPDFGQIGNLAQLGGIWQRTICPVLERRWQSARQAFRRLEIHVKLMFSTTSTQTTNFRNMIESGVDLFGPLQPDTPNVNLRMLKREFGDRLSFYGGIDTREILASGSENDVRQHVKDCLEQFCRGGGFILAPSQDVRADISPKNIVAMCETAKVYGRYPVR